MDVQRLRVLRELADRGSVTAVAAALSYTPSAISQQLKALAEEIGSPVTEPAGRGVRLTEAGLVLVERAEEVLAAMARAQAAVDALHSEPAGAVSLTFFPSGARMLLPGLLRRFADGPIRIRADVADPPPGDVPALTAGVDVVVSHHDELNPPPTRDARRWVSVPLMREPLDVVLPPGHRLARRRGLRLADLTGEDWISVSVGWPVDDVLRTIALRTGVQPRVVHRINDFAVTEELVAAGLGIALLPRYSTDDRGGRRLARRPLRGVRAARTVEAVARAATAARPAVATVLDALCAEAAAVVARG